MVDNDANFSIDDISSVPLILKLINACVKINGFIEGTHSAFQADMREGLKKNGLLDE